MFYDNNFKAEIAVPDVRPSGIFKTDGYIDLAHHSDQQIASLVLERLELLDSKRANKRAR
ncbi:MAG TPA: hypothetical protein VI386_32440 [Candidatus Sulfotelmatobacter sp.]